MTFAGMRVFVRQKNCGGQACISVLCASTVEAYASQYLLSYPVSCKNFRGRTATSNRASAFLIAGKSFQWRSFRADFHKHAILAASLHLLLCGRDTGRCQVLRSSTPHARTLPNLCGLRPHDRQSSMAPTTRVLLAENTLVSPPIYLEVKSGTNARAGS